MPKLVLIALVLIAGILAVTLLTPAHYEAGPAKQELLGTGKFVVAQSGTEIITENYSLVYTDKDGYILISQATLGQGRKIAQQYQLTPRFSLAFYQLGIDTQSASRIVSAQPHGAGLYLEVHAGRQVQTRNIPNRRNTFILDNNLVSQYQLLILAIEAEKLDRDFTAVVPQALLTLSAHLDGPNTATFTSAGKTFTGKYYTLELGKRRITLLTYKDHLVGLFNPAQDVSAYDQTLFPAGVTYGPATGRGGKTPGA